MVLPPNLLRIELPEKSVVRNNAKAKHSVGHLRSRGIEIVIDDTGTGVSALPHLQTFPLDALKIDRAFIQRLERDPAACGMMRTVIALASALGVSSIAEGVETPEQLAILQANGVQSAQGFLLGKPMPATEVPQWLAESKTCLAGLLAQPS